MKNLNFNLIVFLISICLHSKSFAQSFVINDVRLGDTAINYVNPEISPIGNYMVWIEVDPNGTTGKVWQCGIDPTTGDLIPSNGKGYSPFYSTIYARPGDWGVDTLGVYYVGQTIIGQMKFVRPTGPTSAIVTDIGLPTDNKRRVFYPSQLPNVNKRFVSYIWNNSVPGFSPYTPQNSYYQLRLLDLDNPANDYLIEQQNAIYPLPVPMDIIVPRWIKGTPYLTFGFKDANNRAQVKEFCALTPFNPPIPVTNDIANKIDGYPVRNPLTGAQYLMSGINSSDTAYFYKRSNFGQMFVQHETVIPQTIHLTTPSLNQSHEPFFFNGQLYSTFQINNKGTNYLNTTLKQPGEIWMTTIDSSQQTMWLLSAFDSTLNISEPEPYVGNGKVWVFYSATVIDTSNNNFFKKFQLRRCETPMNQFVSVTSNSIENTEISIYPNPTNDKIFISGVDNHSFHLKVFDVNGQQIALYANANQIDINDFPNGVYFVQIIKERFIQTRKIIKQ